MDACDKCGRTRDLFHNETTGLALCGKCDLAQDAKDDETTKRDDERVSAIDYALRSIRDLADGTFPQNSARKILDDAGTIHNLASLALLSLRALDEDITRVRRAEEAVARIRFEDEDDVMSCGCSSGSCYCEDDNA